MHLGVLKPDATVPSIFELRKGPKIFFYDVQKRCATIFVALKLSNVTSGRMCALCMRPRKSPGSLEKRQHREREREYKVFGSFFLPSPLDYRLSCSWIWEYKCIFSFQDTAEGKQSGTANRGKWKEMERSKRRRGKKLFSFSLPLRCTFYRVQIIMNERITLIGPFKL